MTSNDPRPHRPTVGPHPVAAAESRTLLRRYYTELVVRYHGRPADDDEVSAALAGEPSDDLARPTGEFLLARIDGAPVGCAGVRVLTADAMELTRVYVDPEARRLGVATLLLRAAQDVARDGFGARFLRLDTREDLIEARALYAANGYAETAAHNESPYADHWFEKRLR